MKIYLVNLDNGKIEEHIVNSKSGETFKVDDKQFTVVNEFTDNLIQVVFYRRRSLF